MHILKMKLFSLRQRVGTDLCKVCFNWMKNFHVQLPFNLPRMLTLEKTFLILELFQESRTAITFKFLSQPCCQLKF